MHDLLIRGGWVVDGSGDERRRADVAVDAGRISAIGPDLDGDAATVLDADGRAVCPGFVDVHTHYDAQVFWDGTLSPSPLHGVTTVIGGNCGFTIAPLSDDPADGEYLMRMLSRVEGMPLESLREGVPWDWRTTAEYLDAVDPLLGINAGFKVGHSALRRVVLGEAATEREATDDEVAAMAGLLRDGLAAGAMGFSSTWSTTHNDTEGRPVPSRHASRDEVLALCAVLCDFPGTSLEMLAAAGGPVDDESQALLCDMSLAAGGRQVNWNVMQVTANNVDECRQKLAASDYAAERGGRVVALTIPMVIAARLSLASGFVLDAIPGWAEVMFLPPEEKKRVLADPAERRRLDGLAQSDHPLRRLANWGTMTIFDTVAPENDGPCRRPRKPRGLAGARRRLAGRAGRDRRLRRRRPPRPAGHLQLPDPGAGRARAPARPPALRGGDPPHDRRAGRPVRPRRAGPARRGRPRRRDPRGRGRRRLRPGVAAGRPARRGGPAVRRRQRQRRRAGGRRAGRGGRRPDRPSARAGAAQRHRQPLRGDPPVSAHRSFFLDPDLHDYVQAHAPAIDDVQRSIIEATAAFGPWARMSVAPDQAALLAMLVAAVRPTFAVEVGTFTGLSSLAIARALPDGGRLLCCDVSEEWTDVARTHWAMAGVEDRIDLVIAPALDTLRALPDDRAVDFAFLDADKTGYLAYYEELVPRLSPHGLIAVDNVLWSGRVLDPSADDDDTVALREFNDRIVADQRVTSVLLSVGDGVNLVRLA